MSVELQEQRVRYVGNGTAKNFPFAFTIEEPSQVQVVRAPDGGDEVTLALGTDYSVALNSDGTGSVTLAHALPTGYALAILSNITATQERAFYNNTPYYQEQIEGGLDKTTRLIQQLEERVERSVKLPVTDQRTPEEYAQELFAARDEVLTMPDRLEAQLVSIGDRYVLRLEETALAILASANAFHWSAVISIETYMSSGSVIELPELMQYVVGSHMLMLSYNGTVSYEGHQFEEQGAFGAVSRSVVMLHELRVGDVLQFRVVNPQPKDQPGGGGSIVVVDPELDADSENPVQNKVVYEALQGKQDELVSGTTIKTLNGQSLLGSGNLVVDGKSESSGETTFADADCRQAFVDEMSVISKRVGAKSSTWLDPTGIENKSTASDMCKILLHASGYEKLYDIWNTPSWDAKRIQSDGSIVTSTITSSVVGNDASKSLTSYYNVMGGKTGTLNRYSTNNLGVVVQSAKDADTLYAVVVLQADTNNAGTGNRFVATKEVMDIVESADTSNDAHVSPLDEVAYENLTWRQIFINNNYAPNLNDGKYTSSKGVTYTVSNGTCTVVTDENNAENYVPPYALDVSGTTSCQIKGNQKVTVGELYLMACNVNVSAYTAGYCGVIIGAGAQGATVNRVTSGWEAVTQRITPATSTNATLYIGSATSANLTGKVNNPVIVSANIFDEVPDEATWQQLFETYNQKIVEDKALTGGTESGGESIDLPDPQAEYACAIKVPRVPRAFQYLTLKPSYQKKANDEWYPASMSKILTALVLLNYVSDLNEKVKVRQEDVDALVAYGSGWYANDIVVGDTITYLDLLYFMFLPSSNIATQIVARGVGEKILRSKNL